MTQIQNGPAGRIARLRAMMDERGYDAVVVRDEANLRWLTGAMRVFDYTGEYPHAAFITTEDCFLHTDSRYFNTFEENLPAGVEWKLDMDAVSYTHLASRGQPEAQEGPHWWRLRRRRRRHRERRRHGRLQARDRRALRP